MLTIRKMFTILCLLCLCGNREYPGSFDNKSVSFSFKPMPNSSGTESVFGVDKHKFIL